jgi:histidine phosphotransferase ChpT
MTDPIRLAELICARLCHDLSGPLGPLLGMMEMARDDPGTAGEALSIAADAAETMGKRLRLLRAAWAGDGGAMTVAELRALAEGLPAGSRIVLDISGLASAPAFAAPVARTVLNLLLLAAEGLRGGGTLRLSGTPDGELLIRIDGPRAAWPAGLAAYLADEEAAWTALNDPRALQAPLTALIARQAGVRLNMLLPSGIAGSAPPLLLSPT